MGGSEDPGRLGGDPGGLAMRCQPKSGGWGIITDRVLDGVISEREGKA